MKFLAACVLAGVAGMTAAQNCAPSTCASATLQSCDDIVTSQLIDCTILEADFLCNCDGCACQVPVDIGGITDPPDLTTTEQDGGSGNGDGNGGDDHTVPPPPVDGTHPNDIVTATNPVVTNLESVETPDPDVTPPPIFTIDPDFTGDQTAHTDFTPNRDTTTFKVFTSLHLHGTETLPPSQTTTTLPYVSTSHRTKYDCTKDCGKPDYVGDSFCDDENNFCGCDWDNGDCCGNSNHYIYCTHCNCHDPAERDYYNCPGECGDDDHYADGYCDDYNNMCACSWDGGDCCGDQNHYGLCTDCKCLDPEYHDPTAVPCNGNCGSKNYIGDNFCDDDNNNCGCDWDNGDCCGNDHNYNHCDDCLCLDPDDPAFLSPDNQVGDCIGVCFSQGWFADGFCDDGNNICGCDWDGGDCCGGQNVYTYCDDCDCLDPLYSDWYNCTTGGCENSNWQGDAYCDDGNNNCGCNWDGGDCCGPDHYYDYCDACLCLDPASEHELVCSGKCSVKAWQGDGYCDDDNNICGCDWDGGDCCDHNALLTHCDQCLCLDPNYEADSSCIGECETTQWQGDGFCDDGNNICGCDWDNGDCCGSSSSTQYAYCKECRCQDPDNSLFTLPTEECTGTCYHSDWVSDTYCDDGNNNCGCDWDGGDCCGTAVKYTHCTQCACLDPDLPEYWNCDGSCSHSAWTGDNYCDDGNNNCACDWDGGDCCGDDNAYTQCTECQCKDPQFASFSTSGPVIGGGGVTGYHTTEKVTDPPVETPNVVSVGGPDITAPPDAHH